MRTRYQERVLVEPGDVSLRLGHDEAVVDKAFVDEVELADDHSIRPATRQLHQAAPMRRRQRDAVTPHPILAIGGRQGVHIENHLPVGRRPAVTRKRRAPPEPLWIALVLPKIVNEAATLNDKRNAIRRIEYVEQCVAILFEPRIAERALRLCVARLDPGRRLWAVRLF